MGIQLLIPSARGAVVMFGIVAATALVGLVAGLGAEGFPYLLIPAAAGATLAACGVDVLRHGWRAVVLILIVSTVLYGLFKTASWVV